MATDASMNQQVSADVSTCFGVFILFTLIYTILKCMFGIIGDKLWSSGYLLMTIIIQWQLNSMIAKDNCNGVDQIQTVALATLLPWVGIFGLMHLLLLMFPGWKSPFSNTLGYLIAYMTGVNKAFFALLDTPEGINKTSQGDKALIKSIEYLYSDASLMINEMTPENFEDAMVRLEPMMNTEAKTNPGLKKNLYSYIIMKDTIGEFIWLILSGSMAINIAFATIINSTCA